MALRDHFHAPLSNRRHWHSFHHAWATTMALALNDLLPPHYFAEPNVQFGIEIDVATFEEELTVEWTGGLNYQPPAPVRVLPLTLITDIVEVAIYHEAGGAELVGAIEFVSPANKDRKVHRQAFTRKCATLLQQGACVVIVDIVTNRRASLHKALFDELELSDPENDPLYASAYRPIPNPDTPRFEYWYEQLHIDKSLPSLPFFLNESLSLPLPLDETYQQLLKGLKIA